MGRNAPASASATRLLAQATLAAAVLGSARAARAQLLELSPPQRISVGAPGRPFIEPHLAVDPQDARHLLVAVAYSVAAPEYREVQARRTCAVLETRDGGTSWRMREFAIPACLDPSIAFTTDGHAVFSALGGPGPGFPSPKLLVHHSTDGGATWDSTAADLGTHQDHPLVVAGVSGAQREGWVYVVSSREVSAEDGKLRYVVEVSRSRNHGRAFDGSVRLMPSNILLKAETPVLLGDGSLVVTFVNVARNTQQAGGGELLARRPAWMSRSTDGGVNFGTPSFITDACGSSPAFSLSAFAADTSAGPLRNHLYFACEQAGGQGVTVTASSDLGESWPDTVVTLAASHTGVTRHYKPALSVNARGDLLAAWVEVEGPVGARSAGWTHCLNLYAAASTDGGKRFSSPLRVSQSCPDATANGANSPAGGDYFGLSAAADGRFHLVWPDARDGPFQLWTAAVTVQRK